MVKTVGNHRSNNNHKSTIFGILKKQDNPYIRKLEEKALIDILSPPGNQKPELLLYLNLDPSRFVNAKQALTLIHAPSNLATPGMHSIPSAAAAHIPHCVLPDEAQHSLSET